MARARSLAEFQKSFPDEESCAAFLIKRRWPDGFACPGCGKCRAVGLKSRPRLHECLDCGRQTSVTAATAMHRSKLPLTAWFWAAHLMTTHSNGMSARQLEEQLGVTYKTAWLLTQKLRRSMVDPNRTARRGRRSRPGGNPFPRGRCILRTWQRRENPRHWRRRGHRPRHQSSQTAPQARQISRYPFRPPPPCRDRRQFSSVDRGLRESQREAGNHPAHVWTRVISRLERLPARSTGCRHHGRSHRFTVEPSG